VTSPSINRKLGIKIVTSVERRNGRREDRRWRNPYMRSREPKVVIPKIRDKGENPFTLGYLKL